MQNDMDLYLAYNERDRESMSKIADWLARRDLSVHFFDRDMPLGAPVDDTPVMEAARAVAVFLGASGWGPSQLRIVERALDLKKPVYPVLIGDIDETARLAANGLFATNRWLDLRAGELDRLERLVEQLRAPAARSDPAIEALANEISTGLEADRRVALQRIIDGEFDRAALADALVRELSRRGIESDGSAVHALSTGEMHASGRSWLRSALIWCKPEDGRTRSIALRGLELDVEPVPYVRFWTLAALVGAKASYLAEAATAAAKDPAWDVMYLANAVLHPEAPELLASMREAFASSDATRIHGLLRALRIIPIPGLAPQVAGLLAAQASLDSAPYEVWRDFGIAPYDVFCALATPPMVAPAAAILAQDPGVDGVVGAMTVAAAGIDRMRAEQFARLLAALDADQAETLLREREKIPELRAGARILLGGLAALAGRTAERFRQLPGFVPDTIEAQEDQLEIQAEVDTLTAVMLANSVTPPLAIGLFGEWGTGKSFFMSRMEKTVEALLDGPAKEPGSPFCAHAVQIRFNAWHYADTNLWASLVSSIFDSLHSHLRVKDEQADARAVLVGALESARQEEEEARAAEAQVSEQLRQEQTQLAIKASEREEKLSSPSSLRAQDVADILMSDDALKKEAEQALEKLGLPAVVDSVGDLKRALAEAGSTSRRAYTMFKALSHDKLGLAVFGLFLLAMALSPLLIYAIQNHLVEGSLGKAMIGTVFVQIVAFATSATALLRRGTTLFKSMLEPLEEAKRKADEKLAEKRKELAKEEAQLREKVAKLETVEAAARTHVEAALAKAEQAAQRLRELDASRTLAHFVATRRASTDYSKHLSLVSVVRQDFERLVETIKESNRKATTEATGGTRKLERIILYIDDLDRCPADKVVDVLQAVHLLLAYPLFVVVVGVDARWLLNSLALHYKELGAAPGETRASGDRIVSPQHYLEKIFQIPYALRPMNRQGYGRLIGQLMGNPVPAAAPADDGAGPVQGDAASVLAMDAASPGNQEPDRAPASPPAELSRDGAVAAAAQEAAPTSTVAHKPPSVLERALFIQPWEVDFAQRLYGLVPSPRSAKRMINVYRLLKAGVDSNQLGRFEGTHDAPGEFQLPLLLLAVLIHDSDEAHRWFALLLAPPGEAAGKPLGAVLRQDGDGDGPAHARLAALLRPIVEEKGFPQEPNLLAYWVPRVARFSFHAWHGARG